MDDMGVAIRFKQSQIKGFEAELRRLITEIGLLKVDIATGGLGNRRALARKNMRPLAVVKAAKKGALLKELDKKEADMRGVQRTISEFEAEKKKLEKQEGKLKKSSDTLNAKLNACMDKHGDKA